MVAVKIIKNKPAYTNQAWVEVRIASLLNRKHDPQVRRRYWGRFSPPCHICGQTINRFIQLPSRPSKHPPPSLL